MQLAIVYGAVYYMLHKPAMAHLKMFFMLITLAALSHSSQAMRTISGTMRSSVL